MRMAENLRREMDVVKWKKGIVFACLFFVIISGVSISCYAAGGKKQVEKIRISAAKLKLTKGQTKRLKIIGTKKKVKWKSSNRKVTSVTKKGIVKGKAKITDMVGKRKLTCGVSVTGGKNDRQDAEKLEKLTVSGKTVYAFIPKKIKKKEAKKVPMVLFMCGTSCDPVDNVVKSGWVSMAEKEQFIVISPDYNNYATYSETGFLISAVKHMIKNYPVDTDRIYSTGFSNGGAASVALTRDYPQYFAAVSAMGWMVDIDNKNNVFGRYDMPFQVVQGDGEFTEKMGSGAVAVMDDERDAIRSLFLYNEMITSQTKTDYKKTPYWGYPPDHTRTTTMNGRKWCFSDYNKKGYSVPFAQLVIVEDEEHRPRQEEAKVAWNFFRNFRRDKNGKIKINF